MKILQRTEEFDHWLDGLKDRIPKVRILYRIDDATLGNFGECEPLGEGVSEMKINVGPGYRIYCTRVGTVVYMVLAGGDKSSQKRDIKRGMAQLSQDTGLGRESLYKALSDGAKPRYDTVLKVVRALGVKLHAEPIRS